MIRFKQAVLIILDGWGWRDDTENNAIAKAKTTNFDHFWQNYPHALLEASGQAVGLPAGQMGNSEIGHTTIGAGTVIDTDLVRIAKIIAANQFISNPAFGRLFAHVTKNDATLHVCGLLGDGGVHAHASHLFTFIQAAKESGVEKIALHLFTDGRDTPPQSAAGYLEDVEKILITLGAGRIATVSGRFFAMDRDNNWDRVAKAEDAIFSAKGKEEHGLPSKAVRALYAAGKIDEHLEPMVFDGGAPLCPHDGVFFFNFRADRARQLSRRIAERQNKSDVYFVTMTEYDSMLQADVAFPKQVIETTLAAEISRAGLSQAHIAETEKFPHATYFLNGGKEAPHQGEVHILLPSRKDVPTHDLAPRMQAQAIADKAIEQIRAGTNFIFINFANPDMVGHTANVPAIIEAVEEVDSQLGRVIAALDECGGVAFVTADHGNAELNADSITGEKHTAHTTNPVPAFVSVTQVSFRGASAALIGGLADIAPTILALLGIPQPASMTGKNLLQ